MNRRTLLQRAAGLIAAYVVGSPAQGLSAAADDVPPYRSPVDPELVFCEACHPELFPQPRGQRVVAGHYSADFGDYRCSVYLNGTKHTRTTECIAGDSGVAWYWPEPHHTMFCDCGANELKLSLFQGRVEVTGQ